jgi:C1A family cysteine protease
MKNKICPLAFTLLFILGSTSAISLQTDNLENNVKQSVLINSSDELWGLVEPDNWQDNAKFDSMNVRDDIPDRFDWRELNGCPPIRDQARCGSCWAFATVGALECNIKIKDGVEVDLSEQWLVSCNTQHDAFGRSWSCSGGWYAHDYFMEEPVWDAEDVPPHYRVDKCGYTGFVF